MPNQLIQGEASLASEPREADPDTPPRASILVVDDSQDNLSLLSQILKRGGYGVQQALSGALALDAARSVPPDLVLLDVLMPDMDGYEVCERLKAEERTRDVPVIFISALGMTQDKVKGFSVGCVDYVTKPFQAREILARVSTHVMLREMQKQLKAANRELEQRNAELEARNAELREALHTIKTLSGLIPICAWCGRKIEEEDGRWIRLETYIESRSEATFTHGMCPDCAQRIQAEVEDRFAGSAEGEPSAGFVSAPDEPVRDANG